MKLFKIGSTSREGLYSVNLSDQTSTDILASAKYLILPSNVSSKNLNALSIDLSKIIEHKDSCVINLNGGGLDCSKNFVDCRKKWWSPEAADPKSDIEGVNLDGFLIP